MANAKAKRTYAIRAVAVIVVLAAVTVVVVMGFALHRSGAIKDAMWAVTGNLLAYQVEVEKALVAGKPPPPPPTQLTRHIKSMAARPDGTIAVELTDEFFTAARITYRPQMNAKGEVMWTCTTENVKSGLLPSSCR